MNRRHFFIHRNFNKDTNSWKYRYRVTHRKALSSLKAYDIIEESSFSTFTILEQSFKLEQNLISRLFLDSISDLTSLHWSSLENLVFRHLWNLKSPKESLILFNAVLLTNLKINFTHCI